MSTSALGLTLGRKAQPPCSRQTMPWAHADKICSAVEHQTCQLHLQMRGHAIGRGHAEMLVMLERARPRGRRDARGRVERAGRLGLACCARAGLGWRMRPQLLRKVTAFHLKPSRTGCPILSNFTS